MKIVKYLSIFVASIVLMLAAILFIQFNDSEKWSNDAHQSVLKRQIINVNSSDTVQVQQEILATLVKVADEYKLGIVRVDDDVGLAASYEIGIYDPHDIIKFSDQYNHLQVSGINTLSSKRIWTTENLDSHHSHLFNLLNASSVKINSLTSILNSTQTINGQYQFFSDDRTNIQRAITVFSELTRISERNLLTQHAFKAHSISISFYLMLTLFALLSLVIIVLGIFSVYHEHQLIGVKKLLGYSDFKIISTDIGNNLFVLLIVMALQISLLKVIFSEIDRSIYPILFAAQIPLLVLLLINMIFQYILVHNQKISDFIKANLKSKLIVTFVAYLFMLATGLSVYILKAIDYQANQLYLNEKKTKNWQQRDQYHVLSEIAAGNDAASFTYQSNKLTNDFKKFYAQIADMSGVLWAYSEWNENTAAQKDVYRFWGLPDIASFSKLELSPSGLKKYHIIDDHGHRIVIENTDKTHYYLLPIKYRSYTKYTKFFQKICDLG
ncbi:hypothetical protein OAL24_00474 [Oenococcus sicerae]|nr:hypothetical protein OAL24_00474 [Oenococcus sicerae]